MSNHEKFLAFNKKFNESLSAVNKVFDIVLKYAMYATILVLIFGVVIGWLAINGHIS